MRSVEIDPEWETPTKEWVLRNTRTYHCWKNMLNRCYLPNTTGFKNYGGRGITVCRRWRQSYANFLADMGEMPAGLTLDRINNNGHYRPSNCRWTTWAVQANNRRKRKT